MRLCFLMVLLLAAASTPLAGPAHAQTATSAAWTVPADPGLAVPPAETAREIALPRRAPGSLTLDDRHMNEATPSASRHLKVGSGVGAVLGVAFAAAVISLADCSGSHCLGESVIGVAGHGLAGAAVGALAGGAVYLVRRALAG